MSGIWNEICNQLLKINTLDKNPLLDLFHPAWGNNVEDTSGAPIDDFIAYSKSLAIGVFNIFTTSFLLTF